MLYIIIESIISSFATLGFSLFYDSPKRSYKIVMVSGFVAWFVYKYLTMILNNKFIAALSASIAVGIIGEIASRKVHMPVTVFVIPGIISLVPGADMYYTMYYTIQQNSKLAFSHARNAMLFAASIALGILVASLSSKSIKHNTIEHLQTNSIFKIKNKKTLDKK